MLRFLFNVIFVQIYGTFILFVNTLFLHLCVVTLIKEGTFSKLKKKCEAHVNVLCILCAKDRKIEDEQSN